MLCEVYLQQWAQHSLKKTLHIFLGVPIRVCNSVQFFPAKPVSSQTYSEKKIVAVMLESYSKRLWDVGILIMLITRDDPMVISCDKHNQNTDHMVIQCDEHN